MKGQPSFDNVDELFALGLASVRLGDRGRAEAALEQLQGARTAAPDPDNKRLAGIMYRRDRRSVSDPARREEPRGTGRPGVGRRVWRASCRSPIARPYPIKPGGGDRTRRRCWPSGDAAGRRRASSRPSLAAHAAPRVRRCMGLARAASPAANATRAGREDARVRLPGGVDPRRTSGRSRSTAEAKQLGR